MKKNFFKGAVLALFAMVSTAAMGQTITCTDVTIAAGGEAAATLTLTGDNVLGMQMYLSGNELDNASLKATGCEEIDGAFPGEADFGCKYKDSKKRYTITVSDKEGNKIVAGDFMKINFSAASDFAAGEYNLVLNVPEISLEGGSVKEDHADISFKLTVGSTGIEAIEVLNNAPVYNLNGMLMNGNLQKGVYVQNGKKFIVK
jgi:hypothetical protein